MWRWRFHLNMTLKKLEKNGKAGSFDPQAFLDTAGVARKIAEFRRGESIYSQGEAAESVMYVQKGGVKFSVVNGSGKEAVVAIRIHARSGQTQAFRYGTPCALTDFRRELGRDGEGACVSTRSLCATWTGVF